MITEYVPGTMFLESQQHLRIMPILIGLFLVNFLSALNSIIIGESLLLGLEVKLELNYYW